MRDQPRFDIFAGSFDKDVIWIECVPGLEKARQRMEELATEKPGKYFVFSIHSRSILAKIDTSKNFIRAEARTRAKGVA